MKMHSCKWALAGLVALGLLGPMTSGASGGMIFNVNAGGPLSSAYYSITNYTFTVSGVGVISDVDFRLSGYHAWVNGIWVRLTSPSMTQLDIFSGINPTNGQNVNFQDTYFDDDAGIGNFGKSGYRTAPWPGPEYPGGAAYLPMYDVLSKFDGENANGTWKLEVYNMYGDPGYLYKAGQTPRWGGTAIGTQLIFTPVPEPSTFALLGFALLAVSAWHGRRRMS
ncbi:MAG: PEP-CTERM sorting domain-containing protein [Pirellulales bacterium]|nr:PEP-CTERM sorting domain-containing protein [Pirellulales bacterium]